MTKSSLQLIRKVSLQAALLFAAMLVAKSLAVAPNNNVSPSSLEKYSNEVQVHINHKGSKAEALGVKLFPTGSSLPDCKHACGACNPCKRVMVSFECSTAESCPVIYRCICKGKYYHVPSN